MMGEFAGRFLCKPCKQKAESEAGSQKSSSYSVRDWVLGSIAVAVFIFLGVRFAPKVTEMMGKKTAAAAEVTSKSSKKPN
jgi:hypothetical protein